MRKRTLVLILVVLALLVTALGAAAAPPGPESITESTMATAATLNVPGTYATISAAITAAAPGDTIVVAAGTYTENLAINKSLTLKCPNAGLLGTDPTRAAEAQIVGQITITAADIIIDGCELTNPGGNYGITGDATSGATGGYRFVNNWMHHVSNSGASSQVKGIYFTNGPDDVIIAGNLFEDLTSADKSVMPVNFGDSTATNPALYLVIKNNVFRDIAASPGGGGYGIAINAGGGTPPAGVQLGAGAPGVIIANNQFDNISGKWSHGIGLEAPTAGAAVTGNEFSNLTANTYEAAAVFFQRNPDGASVTVEDNRFVGTFYGVAIHPEDSPTGSTPGFGYTVDATNNWWNSADGPSGSGPGTGTPVGPQVTFSPWNATTPVYDSIPLIYREAYPSLAYQATQTAEIGDQITLAGTARSLNKVVVSMTNWACENDWNWNGSAWVDNPARPPAACTSTPGSGFNHPITLNIYGVDPVSANPPLGTLLATKTIDQFIPFRPSADTVKCTGDRWYSAIDNKCYNGYTFDIEFDMISEGLVMPNNIIIGVAMNTETWGYSPIGAGGPYNSLNLTLVPDDATIGTDVSNEEIFWNTSTAGWYCDGGAAGVGIFRRDFGTGCWTGYVPPFEVYATGPTEISSDPAAALALCSTPQTVTIDLSNVTDLYGYQFDVAYNAALVTPVPSFVNGFFTVPGVAESKSASCSSGTCTFFATKLDPSLPVNGSGTVAQIAFTPLTGSGGTFDMTISVVLGSTLDGDPIAIALPADALEISVCGQTNLSGTVVLQGRGTPAGSGTSDLGLGDDGTVKLYASDGTTLLQTAAFNNTTGAYSFTGVNAFPGGTNFVVRASRALYISNELNPINVTPATTGIPNTRLLGGDANLSGNQIVDILDLGCMGGRFGLAEPSALSCGPVLSPVGSADINNDDKVNIQDMAIAGGNYQKYSFLSW